MTDQPHTQGKHTKDPWIRSFDDDRIKWLLEAANPELRDYVQAQTEALLGQKRTTALAVKKVADQARTIAALESEKATMLEALKGAASLSDLEISLDNALERGDNLVSVQHIQKKISEVNAKITAAIGGTS